MANIVSARKITFFEKMLLFVGLAVAVLGFWLIQRTYQSETGITWLMITAIFSWLTLLILFIVSGLNADVKEELANVIKEHMYETRILKEISHQMLIEIQSLNKIMLSERKSVQLVTRPKKQKKKAKP